MPKRGRSNTRTGSRKRSHSRGRKSFRTPSAFRGSPPPFSTGGFRRSLSRGLGSLTRPIRRAFGIHAAQGKPENSSSGYSGANTHRKFKFGHKFKYPKKLFMDVAPVHSILSFAGVVDALSNVAISQGLIEIEYMTHATMDGLAKIMQNEYFKYGQPGAASVPNLVNTPAVNDIRFFVDKMSCDAMLTNASITAMELILYDYVPRRDVNVSLLTCAAGTVGGSTSGVYILPSNNANTVASPSLTTWGWKPYDEPYCVSNYKIFKPKHVRLAPGETHHHKVFCKYGKMWNQGTSDNTKVMYRGWGCGTLCIIKGTPASFSTANSGIDTTVSTVRLRTITTQRFSLRCMKFSKSHTEFANAITLATGNEQIIDEQVGEAFIQASGFVTSNITI